MNSVGHLEGKATTCGKEDATHPTRPPRLAIIASKGTLDWAYPPLMLATQAARKGWEVAIFFTFYGLEIIHRHGDKRLRVTPLGNPAMPMPAPVLMGAMPGMTAMATAMMKRKFRGKRVPSIDELIAKAVESGVQLIPCGMTIDVFGYSMDDFVPGVKPRLGSADFLEFAKDANVSLFV
jgi:peroxiredoxin family protein